MYPRIAGAIFLLVFATVAFAQNSYTVVDTGKGNLTPYWEATTKFKFPHLPRRTVHDRTEGCVAIGYSIENNGVPANVTVIRSGFSEGANKAAADEFKSLARQSIEDMRYRVAATNPERKAVYTYGVFSFALDLEQTPISEVRKHSGHVRNTCDIPDFPQAVARGDLVDKERLP